MCLPPDAISCLLQKYSGSKAAKSDLAQWSKRLASKDVMLCLGRTLKAQGAAHSRVLAVIDEVIPFGRLFDSHASATRTSKRETSAKFTSLFASVIPVPVDVAASEGERRLIEAFRIGTEAALNMDKAKNLVLLSAPSSGATAKASSVLQKNSKLYGPMHALDLANATTCWNSEGSSSGKQSSHFILDFGRLVEPAELRIQFQAGFVGEEMKVYWLDGSSWKLLLEEEVDDDHNLQTFSFSESTPGVHTTSIKLSFDECTDFYGRVTVYQLQVWGLEVTGRNEGTSG